MQRILCPVDGSAASIRATRRALLLAEAGGGSVTLLHGSPVEVPRVFDTVVAAVDRPALLRVRIERASAESIIEYAQLHAFDLVVVGSRNRSRRVLGSLAEGLVAQRSVPVLVVR